MTITGKFEKDANFTTIYTADTMYQIARNGDWGSVKVGNRTASGFILTPEFFKQWKAECAEEGTFNLSED